MRYRQMQGDIERVLFDGAAIHKRLDEMAAQITADYPERELTVIAILTGSLMFMSDLLRRIPLLLKLDCLSVASYHGKTQTSSEVIFKQMTRYIWRSSIHLYGATIFSNFRPKML